MNDIILSPQCFLSVKHKSCPAGSSLPYRPCIYTEANHVLESRLHLQVYLWGGEALTAAVTQTCSNLKCVFSSD